MDDESLVVSRGVQAVKQYVCSIGMETWLLGEKVILSSFPHAERELLIFYPQINILTSFFF